MLHRPIHSQPHTKFCRLAQIWRDLTARTLLQLTGDPIKPPSRKHKKRPLKTSIFKIQIQTRPLTTQRRPHGTPQRETQKVTIHKLKNSKIQTHQWETPYKNGYPVFTPTPSHPIIICIIRPLQLTSCDTPTLPSLHTTLASCVCFISFG